MEDLRSAKKLISVGIFMCTIDLKDAYLLVPVCKSSRKFLRFRFNGKLFQFKCLPFGLCTSPYVFTKIMKPVVNKLRLLGFLSIIYLDDILCIGDSYESCAMNVKQTMKLLEDLGFVINYLKSSTVPSNRCKYLGFNLDSNNLSVELTNKRKDNVIQLLESFEPNKKYKIRQVAHLIGVLVSCCPGVAYGNIYCKRLERNKWLALLVNNNDFEAYIKINERMQEDLCWWKANILLGINPIRMQSYNIVLTSDASRTGWGAEKDGVITHGFWNQDDQKHHINYLELLASFFALRVFVSGEHTCEVLIRIDNTTAIACINKGGSIKYPLLSELARKIWQWCQIRKIFLVASYIPSKQNMHADSASRIKNMDTEWELSEIAYENILRSFGVPSIDLFASRINTKCKRFCSRFPDPDAELVDSFTTSWSKEKFYAFPPFALILPTLRKIINDEGTGIMVAPLWPSQPWYPLFTSLLCESPIIFKPSPSLLLSPCRKQLHPLARNLSLVAGILSGKRSCTRGQQKKQ